MYTNYVPKRPDQKFSWNQGFKSEHLSFCITKVETQHWRWLKTYCSGWLWFLARLQACFWRRFKREEDNKQKEQTYGRSSCAQIWGSAEARPHWQVWHRSQRFGGDIPELSETSAKNWDAREKLGHIQWAYQGGEHPIQRRKAPQNIQTRKGCRNV